MAKVRALEKGYYGSVVREIGDEFPWTDKGDLPAWVEWVGGGGEPFGGKGDHDGDGKPGGAAPSADGGPVGEGGHVGGTAGKTGRRRVAKEKPADAPADGGDGEPAEPFGEAPPPETVKGNGLTEALGGPEPDWLPPGATEVATAATE